MTGLESLGEERDGVPAPGPTQHSISRSWSPVPSWHSVQNHFSFFGTKIPFSKNPTERVPRPNSHLWGHQILHAGPGHTGGLTNQTPVSCLLGARPGRSWVKTASELCKSPPSCPSHLTCHFHGCPCSSSLTPGHCPGDLLTTLMDTACNTSGPTGTQSAFQTKLIFMSWGSRGPCLPGGWPLFPSPCSIFIPKGHSRLQRQKLLCHATFKV